MKRSTIFILLTIVILAAIYLAVQWGNEPGVMEMKPDMFQVKDTQAVDKLFITDLNGNSITLEREKLGWRVNDRFLADQVNIANVFEPLVRMRVKSGVSEADLDQVKKDLSVAHKKVEVYRNGQLDKTLYIGPATADGLGNYVYMEGDGPDKPYIVHIPGWNGNIGPRFFVNEREWRSKQLFRLRPETVTELRVIYPGDSAASFAIVKEKNQQPKLVKAFDFQDSLPEFDPLKVRRVLYNLNELYFEAFIVNARPSQLDSAMNVLPELATVELKTENKKYPPLHIHFKALDNSSFNPTDEIPYDLDRYYAFFEGSEKESFARLQRRMAAKLLRKYNRFAKAN